MLTIGLSPSLPVWLIATVAALLGAGILFGLYRRAAGVLWRTVAATVLIAALINPVLVEEERTPLSDVAAIVIDESPSQNVPGRAERTDRAVAQIREKLKSMKGVDVRVIRAGAAGPGRGGHDTRLIGPAGRALSTVPHKRMAATFLVTDGQVHDVPKKASEMPFGGPLHVVLTGTRNERDRRLVVEQAPGYALVGKKAVIRLRVDDAAMSGRRIMLTVRHGEREDQVEMTVGRTVSVPLEVSHAGPNIVQLEVPAVTGELTTANNRGVVQINGVRERLRVLLVSGEPHPGERVWRNLLKADPAVDLVHFTILRPPEKQDSTPVRELSLIAFPIRELFEVKLKKFDLIIFDRYRRRGVLPAIYLDNVARYVEAGGAVLEAAGPSFASPYSLHSTPLGAVLPGQPTGKVYEGGLLPRLTGTGGRHPVTSDLIGADHDPPRWGRWFRQVEAVDRRGMSLLKGMGGKPLLLVDRVGKGRVAQLLSDHIWLWARGYQEGGPHSELLRRLSHWLMKEPELEENDLRATADGASLNIVRRSIKRDTSPVTITLPSGKTRSLRLRDGVGGRALANISAPEVGVYRIADGTHTTLAAVGNLNAPEYADMRTTDNVLDPVVKASGGGFHWQSDGKPDIRRVRTGRRTAGRGWMGVVANREYTVASVRETQFLPPLAVLILGLGALLLAWRREGR